MAESWHALPVQAVFERLDASPLGLDAEDAARRLARYGLNELQQLTRVSPLRIFLSQFLDVLVIVLIIAAFISGALGILRGQVEELYDATLIAVIVILNAAFGFAQEYRAEKSLEALRSLAAPKAHVLRGGESVYIPAREVVPGDIVLLSTGEKVPSDGRVIESVNLRANEASLTGESVPVSKTTDPLPAKTFLADRRNVVFAGTTVDSGRGKAVVTSTGMGTELGKIAGLVQQETSGETPLQRQLDRLGKQLGVVILGISASVFFFGFLRAPGEIETLFLTAVSLAVAAIPEGLPAVVTISLALGLQRMVRRNALIRKLPAVEALGAASVICSDKTGTLTKGEMNVRTVLAGGKQYDFDGEGFDPRGGVRLGASRVNLNEHPELAMALRCAMLCNDAAVRAKDSSYIVEGDATEIALVVAGMRAGLRKEALEEAMPRVLEIAFSSVRKKMSTVHAVRRDPGGNVAEVGAYVVYVKGAPERILAGCDRILLHGRLQPLDQFTRRQIAFQNQEMATRALRVLAFAYKESVDVPELEEDALEAGLVLLGLAGMMDAPRKEAIDAIRLASAAGIEVVMITGDHKLTAMAVAREMGILQKGDLALTGEELDELSDDELRERVVRTRVYARVSPEHKLRIVDAWRARGHVVAMTGDGVNDAPALKRADLGIAMGITGTDVAKEAADMVLTDDNFASIVAAIEEGRGIYENVRKFVRYLLSTNSGEVLVLFLASAFFLPLPLLPIQLLWINLITDGFPALALGVEPKERGLMQRKPRSPKQGILAGGIAIHIAWVGALMAIGSLGLYLWALPRRDIAEARTLAFYAVAMFQVFHVLAIRVSRESVFTAGFFRNRYLIGAVLLTVGLQLAVIFVPLLQGPFQTRPLPWDEFVIATLVAGSVFVAVEFEKWIRRRREGSLHVAAVPSPAA